MKPYRICCLTYKQLHHLVLDAISTLQDSEVEIQVIEGLREEIIDDVRCAQANGAEVLIGGGSNASTASEQTDLPVVQYHLTAYDYLAAIDKAFVLGKKIAIVTYQIPLSSDLLEYVAHLGIPCSNIVYHSEENLREDLSNCGCDVVIGTAYPVEIAKTLNLENVLIYPGKSAFLESIVEAKKLAAELRKQRERSKFSQAVIDYSTNGLILIHPDGQVIDFNRAAQQIFHKNPTYVNGTLASETLAESGVGDFVESGREEETTVRKIEGQDVLCRWVRLGELPGGLIGFVGILSTMSDITRAQIEYQDRTQRLRAEKGFVAKMNFPDIIGESSAIKVAIESANVFSDSNASVLLSGETGVGKEIFAQSIHNLSPRKNAPFIAVNCAALPENLLESELFGYDEGAFTGGKKGGKKGLFELASGGTIFLDEVGELSPTMQTRLLRVLQEQEIMHIGGDRVIPIDTRVISATNRDLKEMKYDGFRSDLFYRLSALELYIPPLRERNRDVVLLFSHFLHQKSSLTQQPIPSSPALEQVLTTYPWPGNIRELQNVCVRFSLFRKHLQNRSDKSFQRCLVRAIGESQLVEEILNTQRDAEKGISPQLIEALHDVLLYNKEQIADLLGVSKTTLWRMSKK